MILAGLVGAVVLARQGNGRSPAAGDAGAAPAPAPAPVTSAPPVRPERPVIDLADAGATAPPAPPFDDEPREPAWAKRAGDRVESVLGDALATHGLAGVVEMHELDCRSQRCRFALKVDDPARFADAMAVLEDDRGFQPIAREMMVHGMQRDADGNVTGVLVTLVMTPEAPTGTRPD